MITLGQSTESTLISVGPPTRWTCCAWLANGDAVIVHRKTYGAGYYPPHVGDIVDISDRTNVKLKARPRT